MKGSFVIGMGLGMAAGVAATRMMSPKKKHRSKAAGKAFKAVGSMMETVADVIH